jgi:hypothetical protein
MHKIFFYNKFIIRLYMFRAPCAHHQEVKIYYTASGIITPVGGRPVHVSHHVVYLINMFTAVRFYATCFVKL